MIKVCRLVTLLTYIFLDYLDLWDLRVMSIDLKLNELRSSLTSYCVNICKSQCCKKGKLLLMNSSEVELIISSSKDGKALSLSEAGNFHFNFELSGACKHLCYKGLCEVYLNENRPKVCLDYPLFKVKGFIVTANNCMAINEGVLDLKLREFSKKFNIKII